MTPELFRDALRARTPEAIARVRWIAQTSTDPRIRREAIEYLRGE